MVKVRILVGGWRGCIGVMEDKVADTGWWNVRVSPHLRLLLTANEFCLYSATNYKVEDKDYNYSE